METRYKGRYYCRGSEGEAGHCDDKPMMIQCDYCTEKEKRIIDENPYAHYYGFNKPID
jgi:hypothetical protein